MDSGAIGRRLALGAAVLAASGALALAVPGSAQAASADSCAGREVRTLPFSTGTVHVYKRDGYVCAVTVARKSGTRRVMSVSVQARGTRPVVDTGSYRYQAGPVTVHAGHRCVWLKGSVDGRSVSSGWIMC
ncbi:hypothetical protein J2Z21_003296 [Streptomyces griseochromogenes]|uniref:Secreted protein n=1 Tax=Streptomyces griseochromogenes TaxID=68214 RepID=A0A1B1B8N6_9ACTN|nr:hypothetical protein [Streptomyces griseochromogenes]ANP55204.1 hypothetical protein AVL59_41445 [Streptomyces griseochromogenes]MBP2050357.1 hypothetical protein [Streptomyces griseochromogenes]